jgi:uncharacterized protein YcfJ
MKMQEFLQKRTAGNPTVTMNSLVGGGYAKDEVAKDDKFPDKYCGKIYRDKSTELLSMGIQYMYNDPIKFAREDPEYFDLIHDVLKGRWA